jgi:hypothetical protein
VPFRRAGTGRPGKQNLEVPVETPRLSSIQLRRTPPSGEELAMETRIFDQRGTHKQTIIDGEVIDHTKRMEHR